MLEFENRKTQYLFFWASSSNHFLATLDLGAGVEQPFDCLIVQNRQAVQSVGRLMDWTVENDMVDGLFFCATFTGRRGGHIPFVQAGAQKSDTGAEAVEPDPGSSWEGHSGGVYTGVCNWSAEFCGVVPPLRIPLMIRPLRRTYVIVVREVDELLCCGYKWVSRLKRCATGLNGRVSAECSRCLDSMARRVRDIMPPLRRSWAGWMPATWASEGFFPGGGQ